MDDAGNGRKGFVGDRVRQFVRGEDQLAWMRNELQADGVIRSGDQGSQSRRNGDRIAGCHRIKRRARAVIGEAGFDQRVNIADRRRFGRYEAIGHKQRLERDDVKINRVAYLRVSSLKGSEGLWLKLGNPNGLRRGCRFYGGAG